MGDGFETGKAGGAVLLAQLRLVEALPQTEAWAKLMSVKDKKIIIIELLNNKLHGLLLPGGLVSPSGGFASLLFDQGVP